VKTIEEQYSRDIQQETFAMLVAARVNEILSNKAEVLNFQRAGGTHYTKEQEALIFADTIARAVCANLNQGEKSSE
jgi:hypothetical protein